MKAKRINNWASGDTSVGKFTARFIAPFPKLSRRRRYRVREQIEWGKQRSQTDKGMSFTFKTKEG